MGKERDLVAKNKRLALEVENKRMKAELKAKPSESWMHFIGKWLVYAAIIWLGGMFMIGLMAGG